MRKEQRGNHIFRLAMLDIIDNALRKSKKEYVSFETNTYADYKDMIHFTCDGHRCVVLSVERPNFKTGELTMSVKVEDTRELLRLDFEVSHFRCNTLERIANEVYNYVKDADWDDWDEYEKETIGNWFMQMGAERF